jgi:hypothetical protein
VEFSTPLAHMHVVVFVSDVEVSLVCKVDSLFMAVLCMAGDTTLMQSRLTFPLPTVFLKSRDGSWKSGFR